MHSLVSGDKSLSDCTASREESGEAAERRDLYRTQVALYKWVVMASPRGEHSNRRHPS